MEMDWSSQRLLVLAPHPDDESIGCGGLMSRVKRAGGEVYVLFLTVGDTADFSASGLSKSSERLEEIEEFAAFVGLDGFDIAYQGDDYHLRLDNMPRHELVTLLERTSPLSVKTLAPTIVAFPDVTSYNQDHKAVAYAASTALRPGDRKVKHQPSLVLSYEEAADGWSTEQPVPRNVFIELDQVDLDQKIKGLGLHASQWRDHPSTRSEETLRGLAALRGGQSGLPLAEAFHCLRWMVC